MDEIIFVDTENVGYNIIKNLNLDKIKKLVLVDGSRENSIRLNADILQTLLDFSNKGTIERVYTDKKDKNAADYLLILKIGMFVSDNENKYKIKILSGDKIFLIIAELLKEMGYTVEVINTHTKKEKIVENYIVNSESSDSSIRSKKNNEIIEVINVEEYLESNERKRKRVQEYLDFNNIDFFNINKEWVLNDIKIYLEKLWHDENISKLDNKKNILEKLNMNSKSGYNFAIRTAIKKHPQYNTHNKNNDIVYFKE
jgi:hypothetical protein